MVTWATISHCIRCAHLFHAGLRKRTSDGFSSQSSLPRQSSVADVPMPEIKMNVVWCLFCVVKIFFAAVLLLGLPGSQARHEPAHCKRAKTAKDIIRAIKRASDVNILSVCLDGDPSTYVSTHEAVASALFDMDATAITPRQQKCTIKLSDYFYDHIAFMN
jgi:hypothetical protein